MGAIETSPTAVPFKADVCVPALSVTESVSSSSPGDCAVSGLNCTVTIQVPPDARVVVPPAGPQVVSGAPSMA